MSFIYETTSGRNLPDDALLGWKLARNFGIVKDDAPVCVPTALWKLAAQSWSQSLPSAVIGIFEHFDATVRWEEILGVLEHFNKRTKVLLVVLALDANDAAKLPVCPRGPAS